MAFHWKDGWYFERIEQDDRHPKDGTVRIYHIEPGTRPEIADVDIEIDPASWASIVASVTPKGENTYTFRMAETLHDYKETP